MRIVYHPSVFAEIDAIMRYYEEVGGYSLADDFYDEFKQAVRHASLFPEHFRLRKGNLRRVNLRRFPYNFLFRYIDNQVRVLVVRHQAREPRYGTQRK